MGLDKAHIETDKILYELEKDLRRLFKQSNRDFQKEIDGLIGKIYLGGVESTQRKRLKHAEKHGKNEIIERFVEAIISAQEQTVEKINASHAEIYRINYIHACDTLIKQLKGGD
jgi:hypothetical protein